MLYALMADDCRDDQFLFKHALKASGVEASVFFVDDGEDAINYLQGAGSYIDRSRYPLPSLLILDLKMPKVDGFGVLKWCQDNLKQLTIVVLTTSGLEEDREKALRLGSQDFFVKPMDMHEFPAIVRKIFSYSEPAEEASSTALC